MSIEDLGITQNWTAWKMLHKIGQYIEMGDIIYLVVPIVRSVCRWKNRNRTIRDRNGYLGRSYKDHKFLHIQDVFGKRDVRLL